MCLKRKKDVHESMSQRGGGRQTAVEENEAHILCGSIEGGT